MSHDNNDTRALTKKELSDFRRWAASLRLGPTFNVVHRLLDTVDALHEQLRRSATVCPKDGCMLWKGHTEKHASAEQVSEALAANSHGKRRR